jgi:tripartite-type tricarboxylate transporter receptor subunit TctC
MIGRAAALDLLRAIPERHAARGRSTLIGGQIASGAGVLADFIELHRAGKLRIIATSGTRRSSLTPDVPTFREQGFAGVEGTGWNALVAPPGTPQAVVDRWSRLIMAAVRSPSAEKPRLGVSRPAPRRNSLPRSSPPYRALGPIIKAAGSPSNSVIRASRREA